MPTRRREPEDDSESDPPPPPQRRVRFATGQILVPLRSLRAAAAAADAGGASGAAGADGAPSPAWRGGSESEPSPGAPSPPDFFPALPEGLAGLPHFHIQLMRAPLPPLFGGGGLGSPSGTSDGEPPSASPSPLPRAPRAAARDASAGTDAPADSPGGGGGGAGSPPQPAGIRFQHGNVRIELQFAPNGLNSQLESFLAMPSGALAELTAAVLGSAAGSLFPELPPRGLTDAQCEQLGTATFKAPPLSVESAAGMSVAELKRLMAAHGVDCHGCIERQHLLERIEQEARARPSAAEDEPAAAPGSPRACVSEPHDCSVCMSAYRHNEVVTVLPCAPSHAFHSECIRTWLGRHRTCPLCRTDVCALLPGGAEGAPAAEGEGEGPAAGVLPPLPGLPPLDAHVAPPPAPSRERPPRQPRTAAQPPSLAGAEQPAPAAGVPAAGVGPWLGAMRAAPPEGPASPQDAEVAPPAEPPVALRTRSTRARAAATASLPPRSQPAAVPAPAALGAPSRAIGPLPVAAGSELAAGWAGAAAPAADPVPISALPPAELRAAGGPMARTPAAGALASGGRGDAGAPSPADGQQPARMTAPQRIARLFGRQALAAAQWLAGRRDGARSAGGQDGGGRA